MKLVASIDWSSNVLGGVGLLFLSLCKCSFDGEVLNGAKLSILIASPLSAVIGLLILKRGSLMLQLSNSFENT